MSAGKIIHMHTHVRAKELKQVRVFTTSRALEILLAENDVKDAKALLDAAQDNEERVVLLEIVVDRLERLVSTVMR